jgi:hypothetical protein
MSVSLRYLQLIGIEAVCNRIVISAPFICMGSMHTIKLQVCQKILVCVPSHKYL